jgi:predicted nucleic acid-binding protein
VSILLLDASIWLAALDTDDRHHAAARQLIDATTDGGSPLAALDLTLYEVANVAIVRWGSRAAADRVVRLVRLACPGTFERIDEELAGQAIRVAGKHGLTVYDAAYVATAQRHGWTLVSGDLTDLVQPGHAVAPETVEAER